jgi:uncharacterized protein YidB (DUF937 family)
MSGILGQILGSVLSGGQQGQPTAIVGVLQQVLTSAEGNTGGISALITKFQAVGLGQHVQSWVGTGENLPISAEDLSKVFSSEQVSEWAKQAGTTPDALMGVLAKALPHAVDHLTPSGQVPAQSADVSSMFSKLMEGFGTPRAP